MDTRRVSVTVDAETWNRLTDLIPWGSRSVVVRALLELFAESVEKNGLIMLGAIQDRKVSLVLRSNFEQQEIPHDLST
jgi:hypothetical protein